MIPNFSKELIGIVGLPQYFCVTGSYLYLNITYNIGHFHLKIINQNERQHVWRASYGPGMHCFMNINSFNLL